MESQHGIGDSSLALSQQMPDMAKEEVLDRLTSIYNEILAIETEDPETKHNKNILFINRIYRDDPLITEALKCISVKDSVLRNRTLTEKEIDSVATEYIRLKCAQIEMMEQFIRIMDILRTTSSFDAFYKAIAAASYYEQFHEGKVIQTNFGTYRLAAVICNKEGLRAVYFEPDEKNSRNVVSPLLSVRGTVAGHKENVLDDLHSSIGSIAFRAGKDELFNLLQESFAKFPQGCVVLGHSLGGAIAQHMAVEFVEHKFISQVYHYNSPGIGDKATSKFVKAIEKADFIPDIIEVQHKWDILSRFGGPHLPATSRVVLDSKEEVTYSVAHAILALMESSHAGSLECQIVKKSPEEVERYHYFSIETLRWIFAPLLRRVVRYWYPAERLALESGQVEEVSIEDAFFEKHKL